MIKVLVFIRKRPDLSREQFIDYYERNHAPLAMRLFPMFHSYRRNYMLEEMFGQSRDNAYDVVTEIGFANDADYARWREAAADPATLAAIKADEANFMLSDAVRIFLVDERQSARGG